MELFMFFIFLLSFLHPSVSLELCDNYCSGYISSYTVIRFPFHLNSNTSRCGYPGFDLSCNKAGLPILTLPQSGQFVVRFIDYRSQAIWLNDPGFCLPKRFLDSSFNLSNTPFTGEFKRYYTYLNCSLSINRLNSQSNATALLAQSRYVGCLSGENYSVLAMPTDVFDEEIPYLPSCTVVSKRVYVPVPWPRLSNLNDGVRILWTKPDCGACEETYSLCGFLHDSGLDIGCFNRPKMTGRSRRIKYGVGLGVGIPALVCVIVIASCICNKGNNNNIQHHRGTTTEISSSTIPAPIVVVSSGVDGHTIEKYPKIILGESRRLPNAGANVCPICLAEYQPKEILRTIPECNHYFHLDCIDEWLKMNRTCPVCRKSPNGSCSTTPSSSVLSLSAATSLSS